MSKAKLIELYETGKISDKAVEVLVGLNEQVQMGDPQISVDVGAVSAVWSNDKFELTVTVKPNERVAVVCKNLENGETSTDHYAPLQDERFTD